MESDVFLSDTAARVVKIRRCAHLNPQEAAATVQRESGAYQGALADPTLREHVPMYYGHVDVADVVENGGSVGREYHLATAIELELIEGDIRKLFDIPRTEWDYVLWLNGLLTDAGIFCAADSSYANWLDQKRIKIVDLR